MEQGDEVGLDVGGSGRFDGRGLCRVVEFDGQPGVLDVLIEEGLAGVVLGGVAEDFFDDRLMGLRVGDGGRLRLAPVGVRFQFLRERQGWAKLIDEGRRLAVAGTAEELA